MIKTSNFNEKIKLLTLNQNMELDSMSRSRFVYCIKARASINEISSNKILFNTRKLKEHDNIRAIEWNNKIFPIISMKHAKQFCSYIGENSG